MYIVIVGGGKVGEYLARTTLEEGNEVVLIERDSERADEMAVELRGKFMVLCGDGCDSRVLEDADIGRADVFVAATGHDDSNLVACEISSRVYNAKRCIARVNSPKNLRIFRKLGIESVSSTTLIARLIEEEATLGSMNAVSTLTQGNIGLFETVLPPMKGHHNPMEGMAVGDIEMPEGTLIIAVIRDEGPEIVGKQTLVHAGENLIIVADTDRFRDVRLALKNR
ncbi:MAG: potassium channel family protein [Eggerthellaceae bacterium]